MVSGLSGNRSGNGVGSVDAERNVQNEEAPEGRALPSELSGWGFTKKRGGQGGGDCLERWDVGLAEEIARVERAALDWGAHVDALEGQFVRALLKAIEETGKRILRRSAILRRCWRRRVEKAKPSGVGSNG